MVYIDADELLRTLPDDLPYKASVKRVLMQAPEADVVEVMHGTWVKVYRNKTAIVYECSCCGHLTLGTTDYCICGARMDGELNCK